MQDDNNFTMQELYPTENSAMYPNIPDVPLQDLNNPSMRYNADVFRIVKELQVGMGDIVFRMDKSGMWLGADLFSEAPFNVDMKGNVIAASLTINGGTITGATVQTAATGLRVRLNGSTDKLEFLFNNTIYASLYPTTFPGGNGVTLETLSGATGAQMLLQEGISISYAELLINGIGLYINSGDTVSNGIIAEFTVDAIGLPIRTTTQINALSSPPNGLIVYDSTANVIKVRQGGAWKSVTAV